MDPIYLDYNATTPIDPQVADAMLPYIREHFGNPSSSHAFGVTAREAVDKGRRQLAEMLGCWADEVVFTSGGTESTTTRSRAWLARTGTRATTSSPRRWSIQRCWRCAPTWSSRVAG